MNSIIVISPYKLQTLWVFDDVKVGLVREPFVSGADKIIDAMVAGIPNADSGFHLIFSANVFPGFQVEVTWLRKEHNGNWYSAPAYGLEGWLCPALMKYFESVPARIFAKAVAKV